MADDSISEEFFENLQSLDSHFSDAFSGETLSCPLMSELCDVDNRYDDSAEVDSGGMKTIISATDKMTYRQVAKAKLKEGKSENKERFIREARLTASLEHPNIIPVYDLGVDEDDPFFTMKMIQGENLSDLIRKLKKDPGRYSLQELMQIYLKICDAVAYAHSKKVIHLDLKPANIRLGKFGEVIVCDWGLAKIIGDDFTEETVSLDPNIYNDMTLDGVIKGSPGFLAPEQAASDFGCKDERTDIYALGGILYNLLTHVPPIKNRDIDESIKATINGAIVPPSQINSKIPQSLAAVSMKALSLEKGERYNTVIELRDEINKWLTGFATEAEDAGFIKSLWLLLKRHRTVCGLLALIILITSVLTLKVIVNQRQALAARELYLNEKEHGRQQGIQESSRLYDLSWQNVRAYSFDDSLKNINLAVEKNPENASFWDWKARLHIIRQEFNAADVAFKKAGKKRGRMLELVAKYKEIKSDDSRLLSIKELDPFIDQMAHIQYTYLLCGYADQVAKNLQYRIDLAMLFMRKVSNRNIENWDYDINIVGDKVEIDFSRLKGLFSIAGIRFLPVSKLDIAGTNVSFTQDLTMLPLEELNITSTKILDPRPIFGIKTLKKVTFSRTQYKNVYIPKHIEVKKVKSLVNN